MGAKCTIEPFRDSDGEIIGDANHDAYDEIHAVGLYCGDEATLCGMPFVDEGHPPN